jgi:hypothetical protein
MWPNTQDLAKGNEIDLISTGKSFVTTFDGHGRILSWSEVAATPSQEWKYVLDHAVWSLLMFPHESLTFTDSKVTGR